MQRELVRLVGQYEDAFNANDANAMNALFAAEPVFVNFNGIVVSDKDALLKAQQAVFAEGGPLAAVEVTYTVEKVTHLAPGLAAVHSRQRTRRPDNERNTDGEQDTNGGADPMEAVFLIVARRTGDEWRIVLGQNTPVA